MKKYYKVVAKCGHVGRNKYILRNFYVRALDGKEAAEIARRMPRVKHDHKDAIRSVDEIDLETYRLGLMEVRSDPYRQCTSVQEQRRRCPGLDAKIRYEEKKSLPKKKMHMRSRLVEESKKQDWKEKHRNKDYGQD